MGGAYYNNPLIFLLEILFGAYILVVMLRFLLQLVRADFYNPLSQFVVKVTSPVLRPLRRVIPGVKGIDLSSVVLMWALKTLELTLVQLVVGVGFNPLGAMFWAIPELIDLVFTLYLFLIFIRVILSWVSAGGYNPAAALIFHLTEPLLGPARRMIPPIGGLDLSPMVVIIGLMFLKKLFLFLFAGGVHL